MSNENGLPAGWTSTRLAEVCHIERGVTFPASAKSENPADDRIACLRTANVQTIVDWTNLLFIPRFYVKSDQKLLRDGDILISMANSRELVGKVSFVDHIPLLSTLGGFIAAVRTNYAVDSRFLFYFLRRDDTQEQLRRTASQTVNIANLSLEGVYSVPIALPPLAEQRRIVAAIEQQFTRLDAAIAALRRAQTALKRYRASVLKSAVAGHLTASWRAAHSDVEPAANARRRRQLSSAVPKSEHRRLWGAGHVADISEEVREALPSTWELCRVKDLGPDPSGVVQVGPMSMKSSEFTSDGVPVLNVGCVKWGRFDLSKLDYLPPDIASRFERYRVAAGDVIFTRSGTVGRCAIAGADQDGWLMTFHLLRVRMDEAICLPKYLTFVFEGASYVRAQIESASIGSTRAGFNTRLLEDLAVPLPPLTEQEQIVAEVERRLSVVAEVEAEITANLTRAGRLRQSILRQAFAGRLVPQDPSDEPASVLLERIRHGRDVRVATPALPKQMRPTLWQRVDEA